MRPIFVAPTTKSRVSPFVIAQQILALHFVDSPVFGEKLNDFDFALRVESFDAPHRAFNSVARAVIAGFEVFQHLLNRKGAAAMKLTWGNEVAVQAAQQLIESCSGFASHQVEGDERFVRQIVDRAVS